MLVVICGNVLHQNICYIRCLEGNATVFASNLPNQKKKKLDNKLHLLQ